MRTPSRDRDDSGLALITVIGLGLTMSLIVVASLAYATGAQRSSRLDQDWNAALGAAQAGVDEYLFRLNDNSDYWRYGNGASPYTPDTVTETGPAGQPNPAFTGWVEVPGADGRAQFRYDIDNSLFPTQGVVRLRSTGRVGTKARTVESTLGRAGFLDYLYYTDLETLDPALYNGNPYTVSQAQANCARPYYDPSRNPVTRSNNCVSINFAPFDRIQGPLHTNDAMLLCGSPQFLGDTTTATLYRDGTRKYRTNTSCGSSNPVFQRAGDPRSTARIDLPPSNSALRAETNPTLTTTPGCLYYGPTRIVLNSNGTMNVTSPWTKSPRPGCGVGTNVPLPEHGLIYVDNAVQADSGNPTCSSRGNSIGFPISGDLTRYPCQAGDVFIEGTLRGGLTVAAKNNIIITWDLTYAGGSTGTDLLGLIADNYVEVYHPVRCSNECDSLDDVVNMNPAGKTRPFSDAQISAAILSIQHSFRVQNYFVGACLGTLNVTGGIAQKYRGIVGTGGSNCNTGYRKNYVYDTRLKFSSPPKFLDPVQSAYNEKRYAEPAAAYRASD